MTEYIILTKDEIGKALCDAKTAFTSKAHIENDRYLSLTEIELQYIYNANLLKARYISDSGMLFVNGVSINSHANMTIPYDRI